MTAAAKFDRFPLATDRLWLRPLVPEDAEASASLMSPCVSSRLQTFSYPFTHEQARQRIDAASLALQEGREAHFAILRAHDRELLGWIGFYKKGRADTEAYFGIWLGDQFQGLRYGREAALALAPLSFELLGLDVLKAAVQIDNIASLRLLRSLGMSYVGEQTFPVPLHNREDRCACFQLAQ